MSAQSLDSTDFFDHDAVPSLKRKASSSSSEEIQVTPLLSNTSRQQQIAKKMMADANGIVIADAAPLSTATGVVVAPKKRVRVENGRLLIIPLRPDQAASIQLSSNKKRSYALIDEDGEGGRNSRGTYSKAYTERHPEVKWVHRGQGRFLPEEEVKRISQPEPSRRSRWVTPKLPRALLLTLIARDRFGRPANDEEATLRIMMEGDVGLGVPTPIRTRRQSSFRDDDAGDVSAEKVRAGEIPALPAPPPKRRRDNLIDALSHPPQYGLRHRNSYPETPKNQDTRADRLARRTTLVPSIERPSRSGARTSSYTIDNIDPDDEDAMVRKAAETYTKEYVDAHRDEQFHHTGNGWYRRGPRPSLSKPKPQERSSTKLFLTRSRDSISNVATIDAGQLIKGRDLHKYPGMQFHHKGNSWYKPGPDPSAHRKSIFVSNTGQLIRNGSIATTQDDDDSDDALAELEGRTVDKAYTESHPQIEWMHRGNGRYMRKKDVEAEALANPPEPTPPILERRKSEPTYSKQYVMERPHEQFYHTGNARYKRGVRPSVKPAASEEVEEDYDRNALYDKAYVDANPQWEFHHRGQGRYARGPRPTPTPAGDRTNESEEDEEDSEDDGFDRSELVDTAFVEAHPHINFYHKGQGRWAFGLPPPNTGNKTAVRGPAAREKTGSRPPTENEYELANAPPLTALLFKADGPDKFPSLNWHYRGGGKWCRLTKTQQEAMNRGPSRYKTGRATKRMRTSTYDSNAAQLKREAGGHEYSGMGMDGGYGCRKFGRGRHMNASMHQDGNRSKDSSKSHSQAPTPKPRMLEPHEDILTEEDLPSIYGGYASSPSGEEDPIDRYERQSFRTLNTDKIMASLTRFDPAVRSHNNLLRLAENAQRALDEMQQEYLELDKITAPHAKIPRRPARGGRTPADPQVFEDRKEADLYDFVFDPRRVGHQDPDAQRIIRDAEGRELRKRRHRSGAEPTDTVPGWRFGDESVGEKRQSRQPNRFDTMVGQYSQQQQQPRKRLRLTNGEEAGSLTPDRGGTPVGGYQAPTSGRWAGHVPKRIQQLRDESVVSVRSEGGTVTKVRKGRPPGSKNLHKRRDAGIPKGPRKKKVEATSEPEGGGAPMDGVLDGEEGEEVEEDGYEESVMEDVEA